MRIVLLKLTAFVAFATSSAYATGPVVALRGSESVDSADELEEVGSRQCINTGERGTREGQSIVCARNKRGYTKAYFCRKSNTVCCRPKTGNRVETRWGSCRRVRGIEGEDDENFLLRDHSSSDSNESLSSGSVDEFEETKGDQCIGTDKLSSRTRQGMPMGQVCRQYYSATGNTVPFKCSKAPGYACCTSSAGAGGTVNSAKLGTCRKASNSDEDESDGIIFSAV